MRDVQVLPRGVEPIAQVRSALQRTRFDLLCLIGILQGQMDRHANAAKADEKNWAFAGDLGYLREKLVEMTCFMGQMDPSEIEALLAK